MDIQHFEPSAPVQSGLRRFLALHPGTAAAAFASLHFLGLSLAILLTQRTLTADVLEQVAWSRDLQWVYAKHPPLTAWITAAALWASGDQPWIAATLGPLSAAVALFLAWRLASRAMSADRALIAMFLLEGVIYFSFAANEFNNNVILLPLWLLIAASAYSIHKRGSLKDWALFGLAAALGMLGKYATFLLLAAVPLALASSREGRKKFLGWGPVVAVLCGTAALGPHLYALYRIDFLPFTYVNDRLQTAELVFERVLFPLHWLGAQLLNAGPAICMAAFLLAACRRQSKEQANFLPELDKGSRKDLRFFLILLVAPLVFCLAIQAIEGVRFRDMWGFPLFVLFGIVAVLLTAGRPLRQDMLPKFAVASPAMLGLAVTSIAAGSLGSAYLFKKGPREAFPARELTTAIGAKWAALTGSAPLRYVVAESWLGGMFATYHPDRPSVLFDGDFKQSFWLQPSDFSRYGAILVWDSEKDRKAVLKEFPNAVQQGTLEIAYHTQARVPPRFVSWAFLPPANPAPAAGKGR